MHVSSLSNSRLLMQNVSGWGCPPGPPGRWGGGGFGPRQGSARPPGCKGQSKIEPWQQWPCPLSYPPQPPTPTPTSRLLQHCIWACHLHPHVRPAHESHSSGGPQQFRAVDTRDDGGWDLCQQRGAFPRSDTVSNPGDTVSGSE